MEVQQRASQRLRRWAAQHPPPYQWPPDPEIPVQEPGQIRLQVRKHSGGGPGGGESAHRAEQREPEKKKGLQ